MAEQEYKIPQHVAIIMDGNGRWAKKHHVPKNMGHSQGAKTVERICEDAWRMGIKYLTVYAFSTENWKRSEEEVSALMLLLKNYMKNCIEISRKNDMRVRIIGDISRLAPELQESIRNLEKESASNNGLNFQVAINYGGRDELLRGVKSIAEKVAKGEIAPEDITEEMISKSLDTADIPDPDLLIRTSGELRLSNFLLWQNAYTEFYFPEVLWPDFSKADLELAVDFYNKRDRRFGGRKDED